MFGFGTQLSGVRWRLAFALGAGVAVAAVALTYLLVNLYATGLSVLSGGGVSREALGRELDRFAAFMAAWGLPVLYLVLTAGAAAVLTRVSGATNALQGILLGLVSAAGIQLIGRAFGPFAAWELVVYPLLGVVGGWLGVALSRGALERQEALYRASRALEAVDAPRDVAAAIGEHLARPVERVTIWRMSSDAGDGKALGLERLGSHAPPGVTAWPAGLRLDSGRVPALAGLRRHSHGVVREEDLPEAERGAWRGFGIGSALLVPLGASGGSDGLLVVSSPGRRAFFDRNRVRSYLTVGVQAALALENLRLIEEARRSGMIGERKRLAREIHDTLIQGFASIVMNLEAAEGSLEEDPESASSHLDGARATAREGLAEARRIVWALGPRALEECPLPEALKRLVARLAETNHVRAEVAVTGEAVPLPTEAEVTLLRAAQEALTNVYKHARAGRTVLTLSYMGDRVTLDVMDDGVGFGPNGRPATGGMNGGFGLGAMRERVEGIGGTLLVESEPGAGTTLAVELRLTGGRRAERDVEMLEGAP